MYPNWFEANHQTFRLTDRIKEERETSRGNGEGYDEIKLPGERFRRRGGERAQPAKIRGGIWKGKIERSRGKSHLSLARHHLPR